MKMQYAVIKLRKDKEILIDVTEYIVFDKFLNQKNSVEPAIKIVEHTETLETIADFSGEYRTIESDINKIKSVTTEMNEHLFCLLDSDDILYEFGLSELSINFEKLVGKNYLITGKLHLTDTTIKTIEKRINCGPENRATIFLRWGNLDPLTNMLNRQGLISINSIKYNKG